MERSRALDALAGAVRIVAKRRKDDLQHHYDNRVPMDLPDLVWRQLIISLASQGRSAAANRLKAEPSLMEKLDFDALHGLPATERQSVIESVFRQAGVRMAAKKAGWLADNHARIESMGGPEAANDTFRRLSSSDDVIAFLRSFEGIGAKYARNIPMNMAHPAFRDSIAVDSRLKSIAETLGVRFSNYRDGEAFFLSAARSAGLTGWELDRLLYNFKDEVLEEVRRAARLPRMP